MLQALRSRVVAHFRAHHEWYWAPLVYVVACVYIYRDVFFPGDGPQMGFGWDTLETYWADLSYMAGSWREGERLLWNPYEMGGAPFFANPTRAVYYPVNWGFAGWGALAGETSWWVVQLKMIAHHVVAGTMMHLFLRTRGLPRGAAMIGGLAWVASAPLLIHKASALIWPMVWMPLLLVAVDKVAEKPTWRRGCGLAAAVVLAGNAGSPPGFFYTLLMCVPYGALRVGQSLWDARASWRALLHRVRDLALAFAVAVAVTLSMMLVTTVPTAELTSLSQRAERTVAYALQWPLPAREAITGLWAPTTGTHDAYGGILVMILAGCALAMRPLRDRGAPIVLFAGGAFFLVLAFGNATPLLEWFVRHVPGFDLFRASNRYKLLMAPMLAALAGYGAACVLDCARSWSRERITAIAVAALSVVLVLWLIDAYPLGPRAYEKLDAAQSVWVVSIAAAMVMATLFVPKKWAIVGALVMAPVIVYDPQHFVHIRGPSLEERQDDQEDRRWLAGLDDVTVDWRVYDEFVLEQRAGSRLRIREFRGYPAGNSLEPRRYGEVIRYLRKGKPQLLPELNIRYVFHGPHHRAGKGPNHIKRPPDQLAPKAFTKVRDHVFEANNPVPLVAWYGAVRVVSGGTAVLDAMVASPGDDGARRYAVLEPGQKGKLGGLGIRLASLARGDPPPSVTGEVIHYGTDVVTARVNAPAEGIVVLADFMYPGWKVWVDGERAEPLYANWMLRGVAVGPGEHTITWRFLPRYHALYQLLWILGVFALLFAAFAPPREFWRQLYAIPLTRKLVRLALGVALSSGALWLALRRTSIAEIGDALGEVAWQWLPLMLAVKAAVLVIKDLRWRVELSAMKPGPYRMTFRAIGLGYFGNIVLPFKLGELLRVGLLKRHNPDVGAGDALATIAAERAIDGVVLAIMVGAVLPFAEVPAWILRGTLLLLAVMLGVMLISVFESVHRFAMRLFPETGPLRWGRKVIAALSAGTAVIRRPRALGLAAGLTALAWVGESFVLYCGLQALDVGAGYSTALIVTLLMSVGLLIPSAPGQIGTHQALAVFFLAPFGVAEAVAVTVSILLQMVTLATLGTIGGYVLIRESTARRLIREGADAEL